MKLTKLQRSQKEHGRLSSLNKNTYVNTLDTKNLVRWLYHSRVLNIQESEKSLISNNRKKKIFNTINSTFRKR